MQTQLPKQIPPNLDALKTLLTGTDPFGGKLKPFSQLLESLGAELARTHLTLQSQIENRESHYDSDKALEKLREQYFAAIRSFTDQLDLLTKNVEVRDYQQNGGTSEQQPTI